MSFSLPVLRPPGGRTAASKAGMDGLTPQFADPFLMPIIGARPSCSALLAACLRSTCIRARPWQRRILCPGYALRPRWCWRTYAPLELTTTDPRSALFWVGLAWISIALPPAGSGFVFAHVRKLSGHRSTCRPPRSLASSVVLAVMIIPGPTTPAHFLFTLTATQVILSSLDTQRDRYLRPCCLFVHAGCHRHRW